MRLYVSGKESGLWDANGNLIAEPLLYRTKILLNGIELENIFSLELKAKVDTSWFDGIMNMYVTHPTTGEPVQSHDISPDLLLPSCPIPIEHSLSIFLAMPDDTSMKIEIPSSTVSTVSWTCDEPGEIAEWKIGIVGEGTMEPQ